MAERNVQDPIPAYIKLVASKIHTKTSNVLREKIISDQALQKPSDIKVFISRNAVDSLDMADLVVLR